MQLPCSDSIDGKIMLQKIVTPELRFLIYCIEVYREFQKLP